MPYVYSTGTCSAYYCLYDNNIGGNVAVLKKKVLIHGGHGVASDKIASHMIHTPKGVVTNVSDEDFNFLLENKSFQRHIKSGFITHDPKKIKAEKMAVNMTEKDKSAPLTPKDFVPGPNSTKEAKTYASPTLDQ